MDLACPIKAFKTINICFGCSLIGLYTCSQAEALKSFANYSIIWFRCEVAPFHFYLKVKTKCLFNCSKMFILYTFLCQAAKLPSHYCVKQQNCLKLSCTFFYSIGKPNTCLRPDLGRCLKLRHKNIWTSSPENQSWEFPTKRVSNQSPQLQRLARNFKFHM